MYLIYLTTQFYRVKAEFIIQYQITRRTENISGNLRRETLIGRANFASLLFCYEQWGNKGDARDEMYDYIRSDFYSGWRPLTAVGLLCSRLSRIANTFLVARFTRVTPEITMAPLDSRSFRWKINAAGFTPIFSTAEFFDGPRFRVIVASRYRGDSDSVSARHNAPDRVHYCSKVKGEVSLHFACSAVHLNESRGHNLLAVCAIYIG